MPLRERVPLRLILFIGVLCALIGYPLYVYIDSAVHGGIKDVGGGYKEVDLKAMSLFSFNQETGTIDDIPQKWRDLDGQKVVVYGEMWQPYSSRSSNVDGFQLVYSIAKCCFNGPPQIQHFVQARVVPGKEVEYFNNMVRVKGTLHVRVTKDAGKVTGVYYLDVESVDPA